MSDETYPAGKLWLTALRGAIRVFMTQLAANADDYSTCVESMRTLYDAARQRAHTDPVFASPQMAEIVNRLASLAMVDPAILSPAKSRRAYQIQDVAVQRMASIIHVMAVHEQEFNRQQQESAQ